VSVINHLQVVDLSRCVCIGGYFNCTFEPGMDRNTPEPHPESWSDLSLFFSQVGLLDVWRVLYPNESQFTWSRLKALSHLDVLASVCRRMKNCSKTLVHVEYVMGKFCIR